MSVRIETTADLDACHALRVAVFVTEQKISPEDEFDDLDPVADHILARDNGKPVGTARIYETGSIGKIGRLCVLPDYRGTGLGAALVEHCLSELKTRPHLQTARLGAQHHAIGFYEKLGFHVIGAPYLDAGIPHSDMERAL